MLASSRCTTSKTTEPGNIRRSTSGNCAAQCPEKPIKKVCAHWPRCICQQICAVGAPGLRRVRYTIQALHMDAPWMETYRLALCQPPGLRKKVLPQLAYVGRRPAAAGNSGRPHAACFNLPAPRQLACFKERLCYAFSS